MALLSPAIEANGNWRTVANLSVSRNVSVRRSFQKARGRAHQGVDLMFEPTGTEQTQMTIVDIELASVDYGATFTRRLRTQYKDHNRCGARPCGSDKSHAKTNRGQAEHQQRAGTSPVDQLACERRHDRHHKQRGSSDSRDESARPAEFGLPHRHGKRERALHGKCQCQRQEPKDNDTPGFGYRLGLSDGSVGHKDISFFAPIV